MTFEPGVYYVGDPAHVLPNDDLRMLFSQSIYNILTSGAKELVVSRRYENGVIVSDPYWIVVTPTKQGTLCDQDNKGWGFDFGCFGVVPWKWVVTDSSYLNNKIEFFETFDCSFTDDSITVGHLHFKFS